MKKIAQTAPKVDQWGEGNSKKTGEINRETGQNANLLLRANNNNMEKGQSEKVLVCYADSTVQLSNSE